MKHVLSLPLLWVTHIVFLGSSTSSNDYTLHLEGIVENDARERDSRIELNDEYFSQQHETRVKRQVSTPLLLSEQRECLSHASCLNMKNITSMAINNQETSPTVFYIATELEIFRVRMESDNSSACSCTVVRNGTEPVLSVVTDGMYLYWLAEVRKKVVYTSVTSGPEDRLFSRTLSPEMLAEDKKIHRAACTIPTYISDPPSPFFVSETEAHFNLTKIEKKQFEWFNSTLCLREIKPNISLAFFYKKITVSSEDPISINCERSSECLFEQISSMEDLSHAELTNLHPGTEYSVSIVVLSETNGHVSSVFSPSVQFSTICTVSSAPSNLTCSGVNNTSLLLSWYEPELKNSVEILYKVYYPDEEEPLSNLVSTGGRETFKHTGLQYSKRNYTVRVYPVDCPAFANHYSQSTIKGCLPLQGPVPLQIEKLTNMEAQVSWEAPSDNGVQYVIIQWRLEAATSTWTSSRVRNVEGSFLYTITDLLPFTIYSFRTKQQYIGYTGDEGWLYSERQKWKTLAGTPGYPKNVRVVKQHSGDTLTWVAPDDNGMPLEYYIISYRNRSAPNASRVLLGEWITINEYSARSKKWELKKLREDMWYEFRVSAVNKMGEGDASKPSQPYRYFVEPDAPEVSVLWIIVAATGGLVLLIVILIFVVACRRCSQESPTIYRSPSSSEVTTIHLSYGMDLQLAQLRHMTELASIRGVSSVPKDYMDLLPLFPREKLELTEFLGKGAFGEVFKGMAKDIGSGIGSETKVAVKTLREGATDGEKCEFLMEAYFMSNFDHQNILSLFGVCLDNEPQYLIMELMEGGDLLHYLRNARPNPIMGPKLTTIDLLDICTNVAAGCKYLEDQRFIHRDLAARNCLVSTKTFSTENRVVKIGDFGLARDIYRNDYYHKVGEGLLPVRWMSPESLVDNIYTTQSDVWSFGVLLWEIMGFGQQPYPTLTNMEVLQNVTSGGRLVRPENCPEDMYALMIKCWNSTPTLRPSFNWALQWLQDFKERNLKADHSESDFELSPVNYTSVTTSDEDLVDDGLPSPDRSASPVPRAHENPAFETHENLGEFQTVVQVHPNPDFDEEDDRLFPLNNEREQSWSGSGYLHVSENTFSHMLADAASQLSREELTDESGGDSNNELNYSVLNFPPSRGPSQKSDVFPRCTHEVQGASSLPARLEEPGEQTLLPYMGDLPITDEERLLRKQQWNRRSRNGNRHSEFQPEPSENPEDSLSPYLRGTANLAFNADTLSMPSSQPAESNDTTPKQVASDHEDSVEHLSNVIDDSDQMAPYSYILSSPCKDYQGTGPMIKLDRLDDNDASANPRNNYTNVPTYV